RLTENELGLADRRHHDLLDGADLLFTHDRHTGQHESHERDEQDDDAGHVEVAALQILVEPCSRVKLHARWVDRLPKLSCESCDEHLLAETPGNLPGIVQHNTGRIGIRAVENDLKSSGPTGTQVVF